MTIIINRHRGLTVAEVIIAMGMLAVMLVTVLVLFSQLMASTTKNTNLSAGALYADRIFEQAIASVNPSPPAFQSVLSGEETLVTHDADHPTRFAYTLEATQLSPVVVPGERWFLEIEVKWWHDDPNAPGQARAGSGNLFTRQSRMVYVSR